MWKISLCLVALLTVIASYFSYPRSKLQKPGINLAKALGSEAARARKDLDEFDARLTGKWAVGNDVAPECLKGPMFMIRQPDGTIQFFGDDGRIFSVSRWTAEKVYERNLGAIRLAHEGQSDVYWVVQFRGQDMKTSVKITSPPGTKSEAIDILKNSVSDPQYPGTKLPIMHKCNNG